MYRQIFRATLLILTTGLLLAAFYHGRTTAEGDTPLASAYSQAAQQPTPIFRYPVVEGSTISGHFDHSRSSGIVTFYDGRSNNPGAGFYFECSDPAMYDWVGCEDSVAGEPGCANDRELWYDGHKGTDYEYSAGWHTGAFCNPDKFTGLTSPVFAPARGRVVYAGYNPGRTANGWHIRIEHDLNGNGNFSDDNFRSIYLHFTPYQLAVQYGDIVEQGQYLGLGGTSGYSSSPHLHFEIQRSNDNFINTNWSVDPYGWSGGTLDPWNFENILLFDFEPDVILTPMAWLPMALKAPGPCDSCGELLQNNGFESGYSAWGSQGVDIITSTSDPYLPVTPYSGSWLSWLGGRNNANDAIFQDFQVPTGLAGARLSYLVMITTDETGGASDTLRVRLVDAGGAVVQELDTLDNTFSPAGQWVLRSIDLPDLVNRQGQTLRLRFEGETDASALTNFYLDEISLEALVP